MRKATYLTLAVLVMGFLTVPAWAQKGGNGHAAGKSSASLHAKSSAHTSMASQRSNNDGKVRGKARAEEVQAMNTKADAERGFTEAPGLSKTGTPTTGRSSTKGQSATHNQKGQQHKSGADDVDESKD
jgi:hypothetical protein